MLTSIDVKFIFDSAHLCMSSSANILQLADVPSELSSCCFCYVFSGALAREARLRSTMGK